MSDSGRVVRVRRVKGWLALVIALPVISLALVAAGYMRSEKNPSHYRQAIAEVARLKQELRALKQQYDRAVAASPDGVPQTRALQPQAETDRQAEVPKTGVLQAQPETDRQALERSQSGLQGSEAAEPAPLPEGSAPAQTTAAGGPETEASDGPDGEVGSPPVVEVRDLSLDTGAGNDAVRVQFKIFNRRENGQPFSGYAFVVLKPADSESDRWLVFPDARFGPEGPAAFESGYNFTISNYMTIAFDSRPVGADKRFETATVLVYDPSGNMVLSSDFNLGERQ